jgi:hypothetical protein
MCLTPRTPHNSARLARAESLIRRAGKLTTDESGTRRAVLRLLGAGWQATRAALGHRAA